MAEDSNTPRLIRRPMRFERNFTQLPNTWLRDPRITMAARGLLAYLMTHDIGWKVTLQSLASEFPEGVDALRSASNVLEDNGYLKRVKLKGSPGTTWEITDPFDKGAEQLFEALDIPTPHHLGAVDNRGAASENPRRKALENPTPIRTQVKNIKTSEPTTEGGSQASAFGLVNDAYGAPDERPAFSVPAAVARITAAQPPQCSQKPRRYRDRTHTYEGESVYCMWCGEKPEPVVNIETGEVA